MQLSDSYKAEILKTLSVAIPIVIAQLGSVLMGVTDTLIVGRLLGSTALGAAGLANAIGFLIGSIAMGAMSVISPLISKANAEGNKAEVNRLFRAGIKASLILSVILSAMGLALAYNFHWLGQSPEIEAVSPGFLYILLGSNVFWFVFLAAKQFPDGLSQTRVVMGITLIGLVANLIFNFILIQGWWFFPELGIYGSAAATFFTRLLMLLALLFYLYREKYFTPYLDFAFNGLKTNDLVAHVFKMGIPAGLQFFFEVAAFAFAVVMMGWLGEDRLAAHQIVVNIASVTYMMASGIGFGGAIRVGEGRGLQDRDQILRSGKVAVGMVVAFMALSMCLLIAFDRFWIELFIKDSAVVSIGLTLIWIAALFQVSDGVQVVGAGILRGLSDVNLPTVITLIAYWVIALPLGYYLAFPCKMDAAGIWIGLLAGLTASGLLLTRRFFVMMKKINF